MMARPVLVTSRLSLFNPASNGAPDANVKNFGRNPTFSKRPNSWATKMVIWSELGKPKLNSNGSFCARAV